MIGRGDSLVSATRTDLSSAAVNMPGCIPSTGPTNPQALKVAQANNRSVTLADLVL